MLTSHLKGQKTVGRARASLILANNFLPLNEALCVQDTSVVKFKTALKISNLYWPNFVEQGGAIFLESALENSYGIPEDPMEAECFVNSIHLLDIFKNDASLDNEPYWNFKHPDFISAFELCLKLAEMWASKLSNDFPNSQFVIICTKYDNPMIRFHKLREDGKLYFNPSDWIAEIKNGSVKIISVG
jgi:hypothetical protein